MLAYHAGSGDTHLLTPLSDAILTALTVGEGGPRRSSRDLAADPGVAAFGVGDREIADALWMLEEAGIVRAVETA